jgi:sulfate transport system permease protein
VRKVGLRFVALGYLAIVLIGPLSMVFWRTFEHGFSNFWTTLSDPNTVHAFKLTLIIAAPARSPDWM